MFLFARMYECFKNWNVVYSQLNFTTMVKHLFIWIFLLNVVPLHASDTVIANKTIERNESWSGNIIIKGDITVASGVILTVMADTHVLFSPNMDQAKSGKDQTRCELIVNGILIVKGTPDHRVVFSSASKSPRMGDWYGIELLNKKQISIINYAVIEYAYNGIVIKKSNSQVSNSQIHLNYNAGLSIDVKSHAKIFNNIISENGYSGVITGLGAQPVFTQNLISLNQNGVIAFSLSQPNLGNLQKGLSYNKGQNQILENTEYDVYNHSRKTISAQNNTWQTKNDLEIAARIYDADDDPAFGKVVFTPKFGQDIRRKLYNVSQAPATSPPLVNKSVNKNGRNQVAVAKSGSQGKQPSNISEGQKIETSKKVKPLAIADKAKTNKRGATVYKQVKEYKQVFLEVMLDSKRAIARKKVAPYISNSALGLGAKGRVIVRLLINRGGHVESASVVKGLNDYYDRIALEAASKFVYEKGTYHGVAVRFYTNVIFQF